MAWQCQEKQGGGSIVSQNGTKMSQIGLNQVHALGNKARFLENHIFFDIFSAYQCTYFGTYFASVSHISPADNPPVSSLLFANIFIGSLTQKLRQDGDLALVDVLQQQISGENGLAPPPPRCAICPSLRRSCCRVRIFKTRPDRESPGQ